MGFSDELDVLIRARYPVLYLVTAEEKRAVDIVVAVADRQGKKSYEWSCTTGLTPAGASIQSRRSRESPTREPLAALDMVVDRVEPAVFMFKDLHAFMTPAHPLVVRRIKEIALHLKNSQKTLVIVSSALALPPELEKEAMVLSLPLPRGEELSALLEEAAAEVGDMPGFVVDLDDERRDSLVQAARGLTLNEAENVFAKLIVKNQRLSDADVGDIVEEKRQIVRKDGLLEFVACDETIDRVGGLAELKDWFRKRAAAFGPSARAFGLPLPKGVLLAGVQGCGKSLCAKAAANAWRLPLLRFDLGRMFGSLVGSSEGNVRRALGVAESVAPCVLWFDEMDKAFAGGAARDGGVTARVFATLLTWLAEKESPVFVFATANDIKGLPPEMLRKGRLDEIFFVDLPTASERAAVFEIHIAKTGRSAEDYDSARLAALSDGFSGAEIEQAVHSGLFEAFDGGADLSQGHIERALAQTVPLSRTMRESIDGLRAWASGRARPAGGGEAL